MKYDWEQKITPALLAEINGLLPKGINLLGIAVENTDTAEGALVENPIGSVYDGVLNADVRRDVWGDAVSRYGEAQAAMFEKKPAG